MTLPTFNSERLKKIKLKYVLAGLILLILLIGGGVGLYLSGTSQDLRQQASGGYLDCAGGVKDGVKACSGFRAYVTCHNGAFNAATTCPSGQVCDAASSTGCKAETPQSCAGGVPNGGKACDTGTSYVTCTNGAFGTPTKCPTGVTCSGGSCGGSQAGYCDRSGPNTTQCTDKTVGTSCRSTSNVSGTCQQTIPGGANSECTCSPGSTGGVPSPSPVVACQPSQAACDDGANKCCTGFVCQGSNSSRICQPQTANQCGTGFTCGGGNGWLGFQCDATNQGASGSECLSNMRVFGDPGSAASYANANGCGQVDEVCSSGPQQNKLCGSFQIFSTGCGATGGRPGASPSGPGSSPQPSPVVTPGVTPSPVASPTPGVTPSPVVSPTPGVTPSPTPVCGTTCTTTSQCPQDHTCNNGTCQLTACVNGAACDTSSCRVTACGSTCSVSTECPNDHTCSSSVCKLNSCLNGASCSSDFCRVTACGSTCGSNADCPNDHSCSGGTCKLNTCLNGSSCNASQCQVLTPSPVPSPVLGCNDVCVNNSDCKSSNQICVDTSSGRRCRLETNITSDSCSAPGQTVAVATPQPNKPAALPVAGSSDILKALGIGVLAIVLGVVGFLAL